MLVYNLYLYLYHHYIELNRKFYFIVFIYVLDMGYKKCIVCNKSTENSTDAFFSCTPDILACLLRHPDEKVGIII